MAAPIVAAPLLAYYTPKPYYAPYDISCVECCAQELLNFEHLIGVPACLGM